MLNSHFFFLDVSYRKPDVALWVGGKMEVYFVSSSSFIVKEPLPKETISKATVFVPLIKQILLSSHIV